jgi:hypothetical protein
MFGHCSCPFELRQKYARHAAQVTGRRGNAAARAGVTISGQSGRCVISATCLDNPARRSRFGSVAWVMYHPHSDMKAFVDENRPAA